MDDLDLNKLSLDDLDSDSTSTPAETVSRPSMTASSDDQTVNTQNRPRLRKIKRPKQHSGPIQQTSSTPTVNNSGLVRASDRIDMSQNYNKQAVQNYTAPYAGDNYESQEGFSYEDPHAQTMSSSLKKILFLALGCFLVGILFGKIMFSTEQVVRNGLQGVVVNPEVPKGRSRCGVAERTQGCVLYIMNPQRQELNGRDFYDLAAQLTGRQRFVIETGNMRYSSVKIKPGNIAQLNIPPLQ